MNFPFDENENENEMLFAHTMNVVDQNSFIQQCIKM